MALDDFVSDEDLEEERERAAELKQNSPPSDAPTWHQHEPGLPEWEPDMEGEEVNNVLEDSDEDTMFVFTEKDSPDSHYATDTWVDLSEKT